MSYLVLARKWRPLSFEDLVGQESVVRTLKNALEQSRVAHAYVFSGPRGVGKTTTARILSRALNCEEGPTPTPCGKCGSCTAITEGSAIDVIEIDGASNRGINEIRELREGVQYSPSSGKYKVYIIDEVHMLTKEAFNALLKTLEEPPSHVIFIFATTSPKNIPVTVLSRCQHLNFRRIPKARLMEHLTYICDQEKVSISPGALEMIARVGEGSVRDSLTVLDQAMAFSSEIMENDLQNMLGLPERALIYEIAALLLKSDRGGLLERVRDLAECGADLRTFPRELVSLFRNLLVVKVSERPGTLLELPEDELLDLKALAENAEAEELTLLLDEFLRLEGQIRAATSPRHLMELAFIRASFLKGSTSISGIIEKLEQAGIGGSDVPYRPAHPGGAREKKTPESPCGPAHEPQVEIRTEEKPSQDGDAESPEESTGTSAHPAPARFTGDRESLWRRVVKRIDRDNHPLSSRLAEGRISALSGSELVIRFDVASADFYVDSLKRNLREIEKAAFEVSGRRIRVKMIAGENGNGAETRTPADMKRQIMEEPILQAAIEMFNAKIIEIKPLDGYMENGGEDV